MGPEYPVAVALGISSDQWPGVIPIAERLQGFPFYRVAQSFLFADGSEFPLARGLESPFAGWLGVSPSPVAPGFPPLPVARGFPFAGYRSRW